MNEQLPEIKRSLNDSYLENDWFTNTRMEFSVRQNFRAVIALTSSVLGLSFAYLFWYIVNTILLFVAVYKISNYVYQDIITSLIAPVIALFGYEKLVLGSTWVSYAALVPSMLSSTFILFSTYYFYKENFLGIGFSLGLASFFHPLLGLLWSSIIGLHYLWNWSEWGWDQVLPAIGLFFLMGGWNILRVAYHSILTNVDSYATAKIIAEIRHPAHYLPSVFPWESYAAICMLLCLYIANDNRDNLWPTKEKFIVGSIVVYCFIYVIGTEIVFVPQIVKLQAFRLTPFLGLIALNRIIFRLRCRDSLVAVTTGTIFLAGLFGHNSKLLLLGLAAYAFGILAEEHLDKMIPRIIHEKDHWLRPIFYLALFIVISYTLLQFPGFGILGRGIWAILAFSISTSLILASNNIIPLSEATTALLILSLVGFFTIPQPSVEHPAKDQMYGFIRANTSSKAVFVIPPNIQDFRLETNRAIVVDWRGFPFSAHHILEWKERINSVTQGSYSRTKSIGVYEAVKSAYARSNCESLQNAGKKWNASYMVRYQETKCSSFKPIYSNSKYVLYNISSGASPTQ